MDRRIAENLSSRSRFFASIVSAAQAPGNASNWRRDCRFSWLHVVFWRQTVLLFLLSVVAWPCAHAAVAPPQQQREARWYGALEAIEQSQAQDLEPTLEKLDVLQREPEIPLAFRREVLFAAAIKAVSDPNRRYVTQATRLRQQLRALPAQQQAGVAVMLEFLSHIEGYPEGELAAQAVNALRPHLATLPDLFSPREQARLWWRYAILLETADQGGSAAAAYQQALELAEESAMQMIALRIRLSYAQNLLRWGQPDAAEALFRSVVDTANALHAYSDLVDAYAALANVVQERQRDGESSKAKNYLSLALDLARTHNLSRQIPDLLVDLAWDAHNEGRNDEALGHADEALRQARLNEDRFSETNARMIRGYALIGNGDTRQGMQLIMPVIEADFGIGNNNQAALALRQLALELEQAGDYRNAYLAFRRARPFLDNFRREDQRKSLADMLERNRSRQLQHDTALQQVRRESGAAHLHHKQLEQRRRTVLLVLTGLAALGLLGAAHLLRREMREAKSHVRTLHDEANTDPLTGLGNRRMLQACQEALGSLSSDLCLFMVDIDHFKRINDRYGHATGDQVLREVADRLRQNCRDRDAAFRMGGEEFLLLVPCGSSAHADRLATRLLTALSQPMCRTGEAIPLSASIGYVHLGSLGAIPDRFDSALRLADALLYLAKQEGRCRAVGLQSLASDTASLLHAVIADPAAAEQRADVVLQRLHVATEASA